MLLRKALWQTALTTTMLVSLSSAVHALPQGGVVSSGNATISNVTNGVNVTQHSNRAVIDWQKFNINANEAVRFFQPGKSSVALNRIHDANPSKIYGQLQANGRLFLVNNNGFVFGNGAQINVGSLVATTSNISNADFMAGVDRFTPGSNPLAEIINQGTITAAELGLVGLVAPQVTNSGVINARLGRVHLASGNSFVVDLAGDGLLSIAVSDDVQKQLVKNSGVITAQDGQIYMTAAAGSALVNSLIEHSGVAQANSLSTDGGRIILRADGSTAKIDVSGTLEANAGTHGDGGEIIIFADDATRFTGHAEAKGGSVSGDGGFIEVSGKEYLEMRGTADTTAANGKTGELLLDPGDIEICQFGSSAHGNCNPLGNPALIAPGDTFDSGSNAISYINIGSEGEAGTLLGLLATTNVRVQTNAAGASNGDITVHDAINDTSAGSNTLNLSAHRDITVNAPITVQNLILESGRNINLNAGLTSKNNGTLSFEASSNLLSFGVNDMRGDVYISAASLDNINDGWSNINFGHHTSPSPLYVGSYTNFKDSVTFTPGTGGVFFNGNIATTTPGSSITAVGQYAYGVLDNTSFSTQGGNVFFDMPLSLTGDNTITTNGGNFRLATDLSASAPGAGGISVNTGTGSIDFTNLSNIGSSAGNTLSYFSLTGGNFSANTSVDTQIRTVGDITLNVNAALSSTLNLSSQANINLAGTIDGTISGGGGYAGALLLTAEGNILSNALMGSNTPLQMLSASAMHMTFNDEITASLAMALTFMGSSASVSIANGGANELISAASLSNLKTDWIQMSAIVDDLHIGAISHDAMLWILTSGNIHVHAPIHSSAAGNALVLASLGPTFSEGANFNNLYGANAVQTPNGRSIIYSRSAATDTFNNLGTYTSINGESFATLSPFAIPGTENTFVYVDPASTPPGGSSGGGSSGGGVTPPPSTDLPYNVELTINNNVALLAPLPPVARVGSGDEVVIVETGSSNEGAQSSDNGNDSENPKGRNRQQRR